MKTILFYREDEENGYLSNYYLAPITVDGVLYKSNEHYYQSQKSTDPQYAKRIMEAETCDEAKDLGNAPECPVREDWNTFRNIAMLKAIVSKFTQHEELKELLLGTGDALLIENSSHDYYWGIGADATGYSMLGRLLMATRDSLR